MNNKVILCVEDNWEVQMCNKPLLEAKGFTVILAMTLHEARSAIEHEMPDLIILDIHLPDGNGLDLLRELRKTSAVPVIALTNNKEEQDIIKGLASGCDDYIPKPYTLPVLLARIKALLRRAGQVPETITKDALTLNPIAGHAFLNGVDLLLSPKEFSLLLMFAQHEDETLSAEYIYEKIWNAPLINNARTLRKHISELRNKLNNNGSDYTVNMVYGKGYCYQKDI